MIGGPTIGYTETALVFPTRTEDDKTNKWIIPQAYYDLLEESRKMDFAELHYSCPMYIAGYIFTHYSLLY